MKKLLFVLLTLTTILPGCKKNKQVGPPVSPPVNTCPNRHQITLRYGILSPTPTYYYASYYVGANPNPVNFLLPQSKGKIVFGPPVTGVYGCDCNSGTSIGTPVIQEVSFNSGAINDPATFTAYIMIGTDTVKKQTSILLNGTTLAYVDLTGCLTKIN